MFLLSRVFCRHIGLIRDSSELRNNSSVMQRLDVYTRIQSEAFSLIPVQNLRAGQHYKLD